MLVVSSGSYDSIFDFILELWSFMFSTIENALLFSTWIVVVIPSLLYVTHSYKTEGLFDYLAAVLLWCVSGFFLIFSPISLLLYFFYRQLYKFFKVRRVSNRATKSEGTQAPFVPFSPPPPTVPDKESAKTDHNAIPAYYICRFIWIRTIIFCKEVQKKPDLLSQIYVWTALFYSVTKHIRNQKIVDEVYAQFKSAADPFIRNIESATETLQYIQTSYWRFRIVLNNSGIDPRNQEGISKLWGITAKWAFPNDPLSENARKAFVYNAQLVTERALEIYKLKPTKEHYYFDIG